MEKGGPQVPVDHLSLQLICTGEMGVSFVFKTQGLFRSGPRRSPDPFPIALALVVFWVLCVLGDCNSSI